jgi:hypothetical protein
MPYQAQHGCDNKALGLVKHQPNLQKTKFGATSNQAAIAQTPAICSSLRKREVGGITLVVD